MNYRDYIHKGVDLKIQKDGTITAKGVGLVIDTTVSDEGAVSVPLLTLSSREDKKDAQGLHNNVIVSSLLKASAVVLYAVIRGEIAQVDLPEGVTEQEVLMLRDILFSISVSSDVATRDYFKAIMASQILDDILLNTKEDYDGDE